ncbi:MAG: hypothetical protein LBV72_00525 [Tannerella sp.]|jgi:aromatic ring hydroxylase|nr:hypothetical protein [Tannerella sp.]
MKNLLLLTVFFFLTNCKPATVLHNDVKAEYIRTYTPIALPIEKALASAALECSRDGLVLLSRLTIETSKNAKMSLMVDSLNNLYADVIVERDTVYAPSDSVIITKDVLRTETLYVEKELSKWQSFKQEIGGWAFGFALFSLIVGVVYVVLKFKGILK